MKPINSPFEGLDRVLLYSSSQTKNTDKETVENKRTNKEVQKSSKKSTTKEQRSQKSTASNSAQSVRARTQTRTPARTHASTQTCVHARTQKQLKSSVLDKRHLTSFTFRFKARELEELAATTEKINQKNDHKMSKNDLVRLGLNWLLKDYETNKEKSLLIGVLSNA